MYMASSQSKVAVFLDIPNIIEEFKNFNAELSESVRLNLFDYLEMLFEQKYEIPGEKYCFAIYQNQDREQLYLNWLTEHGWVIIFGPRGKDVDTTLVAKIVSHANREPNWQYIVVAGDTDYKPAVETLLEMEHKVCIISWINAIREEDGIAQKEVPTHLFTLCPKCNGDGQRKEDCNKCNGSGKYPNSNSSDECWRCNGTGRYTKWNCHRCHGYGYIES